MSEPESIHLDDIKQALSGLGIDPSNLVSVTIGPNAVIVVRKRVGAEGWPLRAGDEQATITTKIHIERDESTPETIIPGVTQ